jgi:hypothetical protein
MGAGKSENTMEYRIYQGDPAGCHGIEAYLPANRSLLLFLRGWRQPPFNGHQEIVFLERLGNEIVHP